MPVRLLPGFGAPVTEISTSTRATRFYSDDRPYFEPAETVVEFTVAPGHSIADAIDYIRRTYVHAHVHDDEARPVRVITNDIATIVFWSDGTKTVTKRHGGDTNDHDLALLNCYWRHRERNKGKSDRHYEENARISEFASYMWSADEMRRTAKCLEFLADAHDLEEGDGSGRQ